MLAHRLVTAAGIAVVALLLGTATAEAGPVGVSVGVGPGGVSVSVGRGPVYYGYSSGLAPAQPFYYSSRYFQYGWGNYPFYPGVYNPPSYLNVYPPPGVGYSYSPPTIRTVPPVGGYQSFYPPLQQPTAPARPAAPTQPAPSQPYTLPTPRPAAPAQDSNSVLLSVRLPDPNAELWIDGTRATRQGATRQFVSPPLTPGKRYSYDLQARWTENGREVSQTRRVIVEAGQQHSIDFTQPPRPGEEVAPARAVSATSVSMRGEYKLCLPGGG